MQMSVRGRFVGTCGEEGLRRFTIIFTDAHDKFLLSVDCLVKPSHSGTDAIGAIAYALLQLGVEVVDYNLRLARRKAGFGALQRIGSIHIAHCELLVSLAALPVREPGVQVFFFFVNFFVFGYLASSTCLVPSILVLGRSTISPIFLF